MIDLIEIYVHWYAGRSQAQIADSLGMDRKTVRKYLAPVAGAGLVVGGPPVMTEADWRVRAQSWFPALVDRGLRQVTWPAIDVHRDYVTAQLKAGVTVSTIHQRLVHEHGLEASVASLRRWVAGNLPEEVRRAQVRVLRPGPVEPGSEAQIDYGRLGMWTDPATGRKHTVQAFVMVLACSRYMFVRPGLRMDQEARTRCHVEAFAFFGGVPARLVYENVPRNIFVFLWPAGLCGRTRADLPPTYVTARWCWAPRHIMLGWGDGGFLNLSVEKGSCHVGGVFRQAVHGRSDPGFVDGRGDRELRGLAGRASLQRQEHLASRSDRVRVRRVRWCTRDQCYQWVACAPRGVRGRAGRPPRRAYEVDASDG